MHLFYDSFSKKSPQDLDSMILLMTKWVYDFNSQQQLRAVYTLIDISFPLSQVVFLMCVCVRLTNGPIGSENHHLEMACGGKYPNKGSGFWLGHPFWSVGGLHLIHRPHTPTTTILHTSSRRRAFARSTSWGFTYGLLLRHGHYWSWWKNVQYHRASGIKAGGMVAFSYWMVGELLWLYSLTRETANY